MIKTLENIRDSKVLEDGVYYVTAFEGFKSHFLGINNKNQIALLLKTTNNEDKRFADFKGKNLQILYDRESSINNNGEFKRDRLTVLQLISDEINIKEYFIDISKILLNKLGENPKLNSVDKELENVKDIFLNLRKSRIKEEIGLWGELFLIYIQKNKEKAISSWHINSKDRIDFNSGTVKLEVKTTLSNDRKHIFKLNQLRNHYSENVLVCSIMTNEIEKGLSIIDLVKNISNGIDSDSKFKLEQKISSVLGNELFNIGLRNFDESSAKDSLKIYNSENIPAIEKGCYSQEITNISFTSDMSKSIPIEISKENLFD